MKTVYEKSPGLTSNPMHYCPGCTHGIIHKLVAEALVECGVLDRTILVAPVGCSVFAYEYFNCDAQEAAHGRAPAVATAIKRVHPDSIVFTYQGDGDLASIGMGEIVHAAMRGENITVIFVNNAIYGMTGGQMAPTTLNSQRTTTSPLGRNRCGQGSPMRVSEMLATIDGVSFATRVSVHTVPKLNAARRAIVKAFKNQIDGTGFSIVEVLSTCPTNWGIAPVESLQWLEQNMIPAFPLGVFKDVQGGDKP
jgi:2-oxoglutarate ferredoxin oxidoreductase subunit beta